MAEFQEQVMGLTGLTIDASSSAPSRAEFTTFLTDGAKEIINILPRELKEKCASITILNNSSTTMDMDSIGEVLQVTRLSANSSGYYLPCRQVSPMYGDLTNDSSSLHYATASDPAFWITSNSSDASTLFVKPTPESTQVANVYHVAYPTVAYNDAAIANFPDEAEYLVTLYAACKSLQSAMGSMNSVTAIDTTAFNAINDIADELKVQTANSDDMEAACDAINTALDRIEANAWGDTDNYASGELVKVKDALDNAKGIIDDGSESPTGSDTYDAGTYLGDEEDVELVQGAIAIATSEIQRAQAHIAEWSTIIDSASKEANGFAAEVQARAAFSGAKVQAIQGYLQEAKVRMEREMQKYQWYQSQQVMLQQNYERGIQMLVSGGAPQPPARGEGE